MTTKHHQVFNKVINNKETITTALCCNILTETHYRHCGICINSSCITRKFHCISAKSTSYNNN